ncbi:two-component sensor histidine kinase [Bacillus sp. AFS076308]|uniref:ATP-binding protein n=1 Tax=unclassified Bacillus (in: firmicutes) TaxID=185979 RepID=UPI000BF2B39A|nr:MULTISPECIES: ATP-binding protein [unclassified Bacillus (in: firmicutes)]PFO08947.1 two-component sensor histidine kinase [Bacillus sp. AFS076308]PGV52451.1 two-component sensor histidine kinase [Bacillus sp. AFS037270]
MKKGSNNLRLFAEEKKAVILFLCLFNLLFYVWDVYYYYIRLYIGGSVEVSRDGLGLSLYFLMLLPLFLAVYQFKKGKIFLIKYLYLTAFLMIDIIDNFIRYIGTNHHFATGNIVEVLCILFAPIFVNKKYFWFTAIGIIGKYILIGLILQDINVVFPILLYLILSGIALTVLVRFYSYIHSLTDVYEELKKKEKLAVIGQMAAAIGHEIRNPLAALKGFTQFQQENYPNTNNYFPIMIEEIDRINSIVDDLMYIGKPKKIKYEKASIEEIIAYTLSITQQQAERQGVTVETVIAGPLPPLDCDEKQLKQVFINLIKNAIESMPEGGRIQIQVKVFEKQQKLLISIKDEGMGIAEEDILNLGEPFFTTKKDGTGLGLMVTNQIIKDHLGEIKIESFLKEGTKIKVILPINNKGN